jgi:hypothetical protein
MINDDTTTSLPNETINDSGPQVDVPTANNTTYITLSPRSSPDIGRKKKSKKKKHSSHATTTEVESPSADDRDESLSSYPKTDDEDTPIDSNLSMKLRDENEIMKKKIERKHLEEESDSQMSSSPGSENGSLQIQR